MNIRDTKKTLEFGNRIITWLFLITLLLLICPFENISSTLATNVENGKSYLYLALIVEVSYFVSNFIVSLYYRKAEQRQKIKYDNAIREAVESLDFAERALLREFVIQRKSVLTLPIDEPTVKSLIDSRILKMVSSIDNNYKVKVIINKDARQYITYKAIGLSRAKMSEELIAQIIKARPEFAYEKKAMPKAYRGTRAA